MGIAKLLIEYANENNIVLTVNEKSANGDFPLLWSVFHNNIDMTKLIMEYAKKHDIILKVNEKNNKEVYPLSLGIRRNNIEMIQLLIQYCNENNIVLNISDQDLAKASEAVREILETYKNSIAEIADSDNKTELQNFLKEKGYEETEKDINEILLNYTARNELPQLKLLLNYAIANSITLNINKQNENGRYPLFLGVINNNKEMVQCIMDYASANNIVINLNKKDNHGDYPLLWNSYKNNLEMTKLIMDYAQENNILLTINDKNDDGTYPLLLNIHKNNHEMIQLLMNYATENHIVLTVEDSDIREASKINTKLGIHLENYVNSLLMKETNSKSTNKLNGIQEYLKQNGYEEKEVDIHEILFKSILENDLHKFKLVLKYADSDDNITLKINKKNEDGVYPLLLCVFNNNIGMVKSIMNYANHNEVVLNINIQNNWGEYPLLRSIINNNLKIFKLIMNYSNENNIVMKINEKDHLGNYPLLCSVRKNNFEMVNALLDYAKNNNIRLVVGEGVISEAMVIPDGDPRIVEVLKEFRKNNPVEGSSVSLNGFSQSATALYDFDSNDHHPDFLTVRKGDQMTILNEEWVCSYVNGNETKKGLVPKTHIQIDDVTQ